MHVVSARWLETRVETREIDNYSTSHDVKMPYRLRSIPPIYEGRFSNNGSRVKFDQSQASRFEMRSWSLWEKKVKATRCLAAITLTARSEERLWERNLWYKGDKTVGTLSVAISSRGRSVPAQTPSPHTARLVCWRPSSDTALQERRCYLLTHTGFPHRRNPGRPRPRRRRWRRPSPHRVRPRHLRPRRLPPLFRSRL